MSFRVEIPKPRGLYFIGGFLSAMASAFLVLLSVAIAF